VNLPKNIFNRLTPNSSNQSFYFFSLFILGFLLTIAWFYKVNFYNQHFFDTGLIVLAYNFFRVVCLLYVIWIMYATGIGIISRSPFHIELGEQAFLTRLILGFGIGLGVWHILMLILGYFNLYYSSLIMMLCFSVLIFSYRLLAKNIQEFQNYLKTLSWSQSESHILIGISIAFALLTLLIIRGLFPGGGGDYYTHYFYYYINVINNHGLAPNDVWYHYYYSKGAGLHFLGMLLMDPEAPAAMTFCCVAIAALALFNLVKHFSKDSFWPAFCCLSYILYNLITLNGLDGGEFQKTHEQTSAMLILGLWAICQFEINPDIWKKPAFIMLTALLIAAAFITQAITVFFVVYFSLKIIIAIFKKDYLKFKFYFLLCAISTLAICISLLWNYAETGLATDQVLNLAWRFANLKKLEKWGVIPNLMLVAWIRDNYDLVAVPWDIKTVSNQIFQFLRLTHVKFFFDITILVSSYYVIRRIVLMLKRATPSPNLSTDLYIVLWNIGLFTSILIFLSIFLGHSQAVSYLRFSSFFFPLLTLLFTLLLIYMGSQSKFIQYALPLLLLPTMVLSWTNWPNDIIKAKKNALRFIVGKYSLAEAYTHQPAGLAFGGINPGTYNAFLHAPKQARIWSTNVSSYCMAPNCQIESVISFKLSSHLNEILNGNPKQAKAILQKEGLNYFILEWQFGFLDILPFSQLFHPNNIQKYFSIQWTDGNTYLLTWYNKNLPSINQSFINSYKKKLMDANHPWFRFKEAIPEMQNTIQTLSNSSQTIDFPWRKIEAKGNNIKIRHAAYGRNCMLSLHTPYIKFVSGNNATSRVKELCQGKNNCNFDINQFNFDDPVPGCIKSFKISYFCLPNIKNVYVKNITVTDVKNKIFITC